MRLPLLTTETAKQIKRIALWSLAICALPSPQGIAQGTPHKRADLHNSQVWISFACGTGCLWDYGGEKGTSTYRFAPPSFAMNGKQVSAAVRHLAPMGSPIHLNNGATEYSFAGVLAQDPHLKLRIQFQVNDGTPVIRFRYMLTARSTANARRAWRRKQPDLPADFSPAATGGGRSYALQLCGADAQLHTFRRKDRRQIFPGWRLLYGSYSGRYRWPPQLPTGL